MSILADGSAEADAPERVRIDLGEWADRQRYRCPNGHSSWTRTNSHIWCKACADAAAHDDDVSPEHYHVLDKRDHRMIPWSAVEIVDKGR